MPTCPRRVKPVGQFLNPAGGWRLHKFMAISTYAGVSWEHMNIAVGKVRQRLLSLDALVRMKLTSFRDKDRVHMRDLMDVGLIDENWLEKIPAVLRPRL